MITGPEISHGAVTAPERIADCMCFLNGNLHSLTDVDTARRVPV